MRGEAWARRALGAHSHSLTGVTHTIAESYILDELAGLLQAPFESWDALVCTSDAGRRGRGEPAGGRRRPTSRTASPPSGSRRPSWSPFPWASTLTTSAGIRMRARALAGGAGHPGRRARRPAPRPLQRRHQAAPRPLGAGPAVGRAERLGRPRLLADVRRRAEARGRARLHGRGREPAAPTSSIRLREDTSATTRDEIVSAADVFLSLSDNLQETFGLTPLEAMAAGPALRGQRLGRLSRHRAPRRRRLPHPHPAAAGRAWAPTWSTPTPTA